MVSIKIFALTLPETSGSPSGGIMLAARSCAPTGPAPPPPRPRLRPLRPPLRLPGRRPRVR